MEKLIKIGVRELVDFSCRSGDLGVDGEPGVSAIEGIRTHQKIQKRYQSEARAEYSMKQEFSISDYRLELGGRVDLLFVHESPPRIEEIKTVYRTASHIANKDDESHWAQVKCYAACYALQEDLEQVSACLNFVSPFSYEEQREFRHYQKSELVTWLEQILQIYIDWFRIVSDHRETLISSAAGLGFPFDSFRQQQRGFAARVYRNIKQEGQLLIEAPTGSGKTISTLFPSVKAIGEDLADQIIYLSAKTPGQNEAIKAIDIMNNSGLISNYLVIQAKSKCCACISNLDEITDEGKCKRCLGFFDRLPLARKELMQIRHLDIETIQTVADAHQLCAFELSLQMLPWVDIAICDLNYIFDPLVQLGYFKTDNKRKLLLIDEMHNLVDRARGMYSACLNRSQIKQAAQANNSHSVNRAVKSISSALDKWGRELNADECVSAEVPQLLSRATSRFSEKLEIDLFTNKHVASETLELSKAVFRFQCINNLYSEHHRTISQKPIKQREVKLSCLNAFEYLRQIYPMFHAVCGFSATLSPQSYYLQALGFDEDASVQQIESSFPGQNLQVTIGNFIDTRYRQRQQHIPQICAAIVSCYNSKPGNYLVFFSSYQFMHQTHEYFQQHHNDIDTMLQQRASDDQQRSEFLASYFEQDNTLGFAIMGGIFAEGIDYLGTALIGTIIVGVGMPQANTEQKLIQQDYDEMQLDGFDFAFRFPGLTRVKQSAGRVIRSETDRGVIILLDYRFTHSAYRQYLPPHWHTETCGNIKSLEQTLGKFWNRWDD